MNFESSKVLGNYGVALVLCRETEAEPMQRS